MTHTPVGLQAKSQACPGAQSFGTCHRSLFPRITEETCGLVLSKKLYCWTNFRSPISADKGVAVGIVAGFQAAVQGPATLQALVPRACETKMGQEATGVRLVSHPGWSLVCRVSGTSRAPQGEPRGSLQCQPATCSDQECQLMVPAVQISHKALSLQAGINALCTGRANLPVP